MSTPNSASPTEPNLPRSRRPEHLQRLTDPPLARLGLLGVEDGLHMLPPMAVRQLVERLPQPRLLQRSREILRHVNRPLGRVSLDRHAHGVPVSFGELAPDALQHAE